MAPRTKTHRRMLERVEEDFDAPQGLLGAGLVQSQYTVYATRSKARTHAYTPVLACRNLRWVAARYVGASLLEEWRMSKVVFGCQVLGCARLPRTGKNGC